MIVVAPPHLYQWLKDHPEECRKLIGHTIQEQEARQERDKTKKRSKART